MTEAEWLSCADPAPMLDFLRGKASDRKMRLFACACCRRIWGLLPDGRSHTAVETAERYAEGRAGLAELTAALIDAQAAYNDGGEAFYGMRTDIPPPRSTAPHAAAMHASDPADWRLNGTANCAAYGVFSNPRNYKQSDVDPAVVRERAAQVVLCNDIFGNPFRPSPPLPPAVLAWKDRTIPRLAEVIYEERKMPEGTLDTARLAVLADALLDAGCDDEELLGHCRSAGPHVRGCWAIDLILGKA